MVSPTPRQETAAAEVGLVRLSTFAWLTARLADALTTQQVGDVFIELSRDRLGAAFATVMVLDGDGRNVRFLRLLPVPEDVARLMAQVPPSASSATGDAMVRAEGVFHETLEVYLSEYPHLRAATEALGVEALAHLPLLAAGRVTGLASLSWRQARSFDADERLFLGSIAQELAIGFHRAALFEQKDQIASLLQSAILPERLPSYGDVRLAARYLAAEAGIDVGGDWYDAFVAPDASLWLSVGDIGGHGTEAASVMGQLRNALRGAAFSGLEPAASLDVLDRLMDATSDGMVATAVIVRIDGQGGGITYSNAGHLPPAYLPARADPVYLEEEHGPLLGLNLSGRGQSQGTLVSGDALLLYTDGLVENRGEDLQTGLHRLLGGLAGPAVTWGPEALADRALAVSLAGSERLDDLCLLVARRG